MKLVFATNNPHKFEEIKLELGNSIDLLSLNELGFNGSIPEDHDSLEKNAEQKAFFIFNKYGLNCFADDTGLEIDILGGAPGVFSARYAGENCSYADNVKKVLENLKGEKNRKAIFKTVIALVENGNHISFSGEVKGYITESQIGYNGFGYDPIFRPEGHEQTFAEMSLQEKNSISHRTLAIRNLKQYLLSNVT